jgi:hypothetical protein
LLPRQVKLGVDEKRGDGGEAVRLLEEFGEAAVAAVPLMTTVCL